MVVGSPKRDLRSCWSVRCVLLGRSIFPPIIPMVFIEKWCRTKSEGREFEASNLWVFLKKGRESKREIGRGHREREREKESESKGKYLTLRH